MGEAETEKTGIMMLREGERKMIYKCRKNEMLRKRGEKGKGRGRGRGRWRGRGGERGEGKGGRQ